MGLESLVNNLTSILPPKQKRKKNMKQYFVHISIDSHLQAKACHNQQAEHLTNSICYFFFFFLFCCHSVIYHDKSFDP